MYQSFSCDESCDNSHHTLHALDSAYFDMNRHHEVGAVRLVLRTYVQWHFDGAGGVASNEGRLQLPL